MELPITERSSSFTINIDTSDGPAIARMIGRCEAQGFSGYQEFLGVLDQQIRDRISAVASLLYTWLRDEKHVTPPLVVFSGCGTSGRIAMACARSANLLFRARGLPEICRYLIAGGNKALVMSVELPEDDPLCGVRDLEALQQTYFAKNVASAGNGERRRVLVIGVTCGVSAPYVMGQLHHCMQRSRVPDELHCYRCVLVGFNPVRLARDVRVEGWSGGTCRSVAQELESRASEGHVVINPVIGPEPITGSSRMKGGSMTKVILDTIVLVAAGISTTDSVLLDYERCCREVYMCTDGVGAVIEMAGKSMRAGAHLYYVAPTSLGLLGIIDASEMLDTYGLPEDCVSAFIPDGWEHIETSDGDLGLKFRESVFKIDLEAFRGIIHSLRSTDSIVFAVPQAEEWEGHALSPWVKAFVELAAEARKKTDLIALISLRERDTSAPQWSELQASVTWCACVTLRSFGFVSKVPSLGDQAIKYVFNMITTGACVKKGCVFHNSMTNMGVSNNKLFHRAKRILTKVMGVSDDEAHRNLLRAIYRVDIVPRDVEERPVSSHVETATPVPNVIPTALLLCTGIDVAAATQELSTEPIVRNIITRIAATHE